MDVTEQVCNDFDFVVAEGSWTQGGGRGVPRPGPPGPAPPMNAPSREFQGPGEYIKLQR